MSSLQQLRVHSRVELVDDERKIGNGIIVTMKKGWSFDPFADNRVAGADTVREAMEIVRDARSFDGPFDA